MRLTSSTHADESAAVLDNDVHEWLRSFQVQSFNNVPQEVMTSDSRHFPLQNAQQKHLPHL